MKFLSANPEGAGAGAEARATWVAAAHWLTRILVSGSGSFLLLGLLLSAFCWLSIFLYFVGTFPLKLFSHEFPSSPLL